MFHVLEDIILLLLLLLLLLMMLLTMLLLWQWCGGREVLVCAKHTYTQTSSTCKLLLINQQSNNKHLVGVLSYYVLMEVTIKSTTGVK